jgi:L-alanine-DL-glutamate epimerase-like enolase superfamily enzyme
MMIEHIILDRLAVPLSTPYRLSLGTITELDLIFVRIQSSNSMRGFGEVATLDGYFDVGIDTIWSESTTLADRVVGTAIDRVDEVISSVEYSLLTKSAFAAAAKDLTENKSDPLRAPIVGIVSAQDGTDAAVKKATKQVRRGHNTIKIKVGFDPKNDAECIRAITHEISDAVSLRVDANQGYTLHEAREFLDMMDTTQVALFEQPLPVGNIERHARLRAESSVPLMLDEEVSDKTSLQEIISTNAADMVKFKQMKQGGPAAVRSLTEIARKHDLEIILGNGVQSDVGCLQEANLWDSLELETAGEFNGWHKQESSLINPSPRLEHGTIVWEGGSIEPDLETLSRLSQQQYTVKN